MTTAAENAQQYLRDANKAWWGLFGAWRQFGMDMWGAMAEWAVDESTYLELNQVEVFVHVSRDTTLTPVLHHSNDTARSLPAAAVVLDPPTLAAMQPGAAGATVKVAVKPVAGVTGPAYQGVLVDQDGNVVEDDVYVPITISGPPAPG